MRIILLVAATIGLASCLGTPSSTYGPQTGLPTSTRIVETPASWIHEFTDPKSGCRYLVHSGSAPTIAYKRNGKPDCPDVD